MRKQAIESLGMYFSLPPEEAVHPLRYHGMSVMSPVLRSMIREFQTRSGYDSSDVTGAMDYRTLANAAEADIGEFIYRPR